MMKRLFSSDSPKLSAYEKSCTCFWLLVSEQFTAWSKSRHIINKKLSIKVFILPLVSAQRFRGHQMVEKENCTQSSTVRVLHPLFPSNFYKTVFSIHGIMCARAYHMLVQTCFVRSFLTSVMFVVNFRRYFRCGSFLLLVLAVRIYTLVHLLCEWRILVKVR